MARRTTRRSSARPSRPRNTARTGYGRRRVGYRAPQRRVTSRSSSRGGNAGTVRIVIQQAAPAVATTAAVSQTTLRKARW